MIPYLSSYPHQLGYIYLPYISSNPHHDHQSSELSMFFVL